MEHLKVAKVAKWTTWFIIAYVTTGASVLLSEKLRKIYRKQATNETEEALDVKINVITNEFEQLLNASFKELEKKPNLGIFDLYFKLVTRVKRANNFADFQFDFKTVPPIKSENAPFFPDQFESHLSKNNYTSEIVFFNDTMQQPTLNQVYPDMQTYFQRNYANHYANLYPYRTSHCYIQNIRSI